MLRSAAPFAAWCAADPGSIVREVGPGSAEQREGAAPRPGHETHCFTLSQDDECVSGEASHIGGVRPSRPTLTRAASSVPSSFRVALKIMILAPGFSSDLSPATKLTIGVSGGTTTFFSPSLYLTRMI